MIMVKLDSNRLLDCDKITWWGKTALTWSKMGFHFCNKACTIFKYKYVRLGKYTLTVNLRLYPVFFQITHFNIHSGKIGVELIVTLTSAASLPPKWVVSPCSGHVDSFGCCLLSAWWTNRALFGYSETKKKGLWKVLREEIQVRLKGNLRSVNKTRGYPVWCDEFVINESPPMYTKA